MFLLLVLTVLPLRAQVSIGSGTTGGAVEPKDFSVLELISNTGGLRLPHLTTTERNALSTTATFKAEAHRANSLNATTPGLGLGLTIYNTNTNSLEYWDGNQWVSGTSSSSSPWLVSGSTSVATSNTENIYQTGSVAIGYNKNADPTAILNVQSTNKGVLLPKVTLTGSTDKTTIPNPTTGLLVYNTGTNTNFTLKGYMFWDGSQWKMFGSSTSRPASATLNCWDSSMSPNQAIVSGKPIVTGSIIQMPYTASNGGYIKGVTLSSVGNPNLTATITDGMLSEGNGILNFALSGTPNTTQQNTEIVFILPDFITANPGISDDCQLIRVGSRAAASEVSTAVMGYLQLTSDGNYALQCNSPDGKFSVRVRIPSNITSVAHGNQALNMQIKNNLGSPVSAIWNAMYDFGSAAPFGTAGVVTMPSNQWGGPLHSNAVPTPWGDIFGQPGIYDSTGGGPEYRRYTWIPMGANNKVAYEITVMAALDSTTPTVAVHPTGIKAYIRFQQITAP